MPSADLLLALPEPARTALARAQAAWPAFTLDPDRFFAYVQARLPEDQAPAAAVPTLHLVDLYCACACAAGQPRALAAFEQHYLTPASLALTRVDSDATFVAEVKQLLRHKLLLAIDGQPPRIAEYAGRGPLRSWVRAAILRLGLSWKRDRGRDRCAMAAPLSEGTSILADPELGFVKHEYRTLFKAALQAAFGALDPRERTVLRLHLLEGLNIDRIGVIYGVHRATIARWIAQARQTLQTETRACLSAQAGLDAAELEVCVGLIQSQIDLSLSRLLHDSDAGAVPGM